MTVRRALVDCAVLSLQDTCVFYPCCGDCFSRIDAEQQDRERFRCSRCGYRCLTDQVQYRYRLSLKATRDGCIFGITVFGNSLNQFFGIHASGLQRLVENSDQLPEQPLRSTLLAKAVEDCFIGRHFIFGIKLSGTESGPLFQLPVSDGKETAQFVASQMILPKAMGLAGCTVVSYYQSLLQYASEYEGGSADPSKSSRHPVPTLLLHPGHSPTSSFSDSTLYRSRLLSYSLLRSQHQDSSLALTPPWQQSLGLVTSSAETEGSCRTQDGHENSRQTDNSTTPQPPQRGLENHKVTEERTDVLPSEDSFYSSPPFDQYPNSSSEKVLEDSLGVNTWFSPSQPGCRSPSLNTKEFSNGQHTRTFLSSSLAWEDLPFSESLAEFLCEEKKDFDVIGETKPSLNKQSQKQVSRTLLEVTNLAVESNSACQTKMKTAASHSAILLDDTKTPAPDGDICGDLSNQLCKSRLKCVKRSEAKIIYSDEISQEDDKAHLSFENEEQLGGDIYDCSADLFTNSLMINSTEMLVSPTVTQRTKAEARSPFSKTDWQHLRNEHADVTHLTPLRQNLKIKMYSNNISLVPEETPDLDFVPPSQSTPIVKEGIVKQSCASSYRNLIGESPKESLTWSMLPNRCGSRRTPESRLWKSDKLKNHSQVGQHLQLQRRTLNLTSTKRIHCKYDSRACDAAVSDHEELLPDEGIIAPSPLTVRRKWQTGNSGSDLGSAWEGCQRDGIKCKRPLLDTTLTLSHRGLAQTGNADSEVVTQGSLSSDFHLDDENQTCDWSRDLFSDSI